MLHVAAARSSSDCIAVRYVLPVLWIMFLHSGLYGSSFMILKGENVTADTTASIRIEFCSRIKMQKVHIVGFALGAKSDMYDSLVF